MCCTAPTRACACVSLQVDETLCPGSHKEVAKMINGVRDKKGTASLVVHLKKEKDDAEHV